MAWLPRGGHVLASAIGHWAVGSALGLLWPLLAARSASSAAKYLATLPPIVNWPDGTFGVVLYALWALTLMLAHRRLWLRADGSQRTIRDSLLGTHGLQAFPAFALSALYVLVFRLSQ